MESAEGRAPLEASALKNQIPSRRVSTILRTGIVLGVAALLSMGKKSDDVQQVEATPSAEISLHIEGEESTPLSKEQVRDILSQIMKNCVSHCETSDTTVICGLLSEGLNGKSLSDASASVNANLRADFHKLAEVLNLYPEAAPEALAHLKKELEALGYTDPRRYALYVLPDESKECHQLRNVNITAADFLQEEKAAGRYQGAFPEYAMVPQLPH